MIKIAAECKHPCLFEQSLSTEEWEAQGKPHEWFRVEEERGYQAWIDQVYGLVALTQGEELVGLARWHIIGYEGHGNVALLDKEYYGTPGYLFFHD